MLLIIAFHTPTRSTPAYQYHHHHHPSPWHGGCGIHTLSLLSNQGHPGRPGRCSFHMPQAGGRGYWDNFMCMHILSHIYRHVHDYDDDNVHMNVTPIERKLMMALGGLLVIDDSSVYTPECILSAVYFMHQIARMTVSRFYSGWKIKEIYQF